MIASPAAGGERLELEVEMACNSWAGDDPEPEPGVDRELAARYRLGRTWTETPAVSAARHQPACARLVRCAIGLFDPLAWRLASDFELLRRLEGEHDRGLEPDWAGTLLAGLNRFCNLWDPGERESWEQGAAILAELLGRGGARPRHRVHAVGHAHIDTAWVWPVAETRRKIVRSTASQLELMDRYPDYRFAASSAQHYAWLEQDAPELFARVAARVAEGRWEPVGGSWVEPDCNLPSGESLVRQLLYGQRYFESRFGRRCDVYWSPDTFGHNGQMPQILRHCGIERFLTQKLSWNQFTPPAARLVHLGRHRRLGGRLPTYRRSAPTTRSSARASSAAASPPSAITTAARSAWRCSAMATAAAGPTAEMLEAASRTADLRGLPELEQSPSARFFERLEDERAGLGRIRGQLYFEYHRGTYTSQARTKRGNREGERALHDAEAAATLAWARGLAPYPAEEIAQLWPTLLRNQFHDILPGTSLREVHERTEREHRELRAAAEALRERAVAALADDRPGDGAPLNLCGFARREVIETPDGPALAASPALGFGRRVEPGGAGRGDPRRRPDPRLQLARGRGARPPMGACSASGEPTGPRRSRRRPTCSSCSTTARPPSTRGSSSPTPPRPASRSTARTSASSWPRARCAPSCASATRSAARARSNSGSASMPSRTGSSSAAWSTGTSATGCSGSRSRSRCAPAPPPTGRRSASTSSAPTATPTPTWPTSRPPPSASSISPSTVAGSAVLSSTCHGFGVDEHVVGLSLLRSPTDPDPEADQGEHRLAYALQPHAGDWRRRRRRPGSDRLRPPAALGRPGRAPGDGFAALDSDDLILDTVKRSRGRRGPGPAPVRAARRPRRGAADDRAGVRRRDAVRANGLEDPGRSLTRDGRRPA